MSATQERLQSADGGGSPAITVFRGWNHPGKYVWSPFVIKLEARLRFAGVRYDVDSGSPREGPRGKIPYVEYSGAPSSPSSSSKASGTAITGQKALLSDSALIIKTLAEWNVLPNLNAAVPPEDRAKDLGIRAILEDKVYFYHSWEHWTRNYTTVRDHMLSVVPYPVRLLVGVLLYRRTVATLYGQGTGRFTAEEIAGFRREIWESFSDLLLASKAKRGAGNEGDPFWVLGGDGPTEADCSLFGFIVLVLICTAGPDSQKVVRSFPVLVEYAERIHDRYFPDYEKWPR